MSHRRRIAQLGAIMVSGEDIRISGYHGSGGISAPWIFSRYLAPSVQIFRSLPPIFHPIIAIFIVTLITFSGAALVATHRSLTSY